MFSTRFLLLFCVIIWGWTFVATKICLATMTPMELIGLRFLIGLPMLYIIIIAKKIPFTFVKQDVKPIALGSLIIMAHFIIQVIALQFTTATNTSWIIAVTPLAMAILSYFILRERLGSKETYGIIISTLGIFLLVYNGDFKHFGGMQSVGDWLVLFTAHTWALFTISTRDISRRHHPLTVTLAVFTPVTVVCLMYSMFTSHITTFLTMPADVFIALLFLGILGTITQWIWQEGVSKLGAAKAGIFMYLEPIAATALAVPLLGERYTAYTAIGGLLVLIGVWWAQRKAEKLRVKN